jgi:o-succinylbenzoate synthase
MITRARLTPFGGALEARAENARQSWTTRRGLVLELEDEAGVIGQGEASPLQGYSPDSFEATERALSGIVLSEIPEFSGAPLEGQLSAASCSISAQCPAARNALETALLDLWSRQLGMPAWQLLSRSDGCTKPDSDVALAALLPSVKAGRKELEGALEGALERGIQTFKFKVGVPNSFAEELAFARTIRRTIGERAALRLDANRAWSIEQAREYLPQLAELNPEFVEEPLAPSERRELGESSVPLALDESLQTSVVDLQRARDAGVTTLILKPTALGGTSRCLKFWSAAQKVGMEVVLSHLFDGPLALMSAAALALVIQPRKLAAGLAPHAGLAAFPRLPLPAFRDKAITLWSLPGLGLPSVHLEPS